MPAQSSSSASTMVALTTRSSEVPAASRITEMLVRLCRTCSWMVVPTIVPVAGSCGPVPETKTSPAAFTAWLYVAGGWAAFGVNTIWRGMQGPPRGDYVLDSGRAGSPQASVARSADRLEVDVAHLIRD